MAESDVAQVECPICGESFDPAAAGGWCTNSDCGEWQYEAGAPEPAEADAESSEADAASEDEEAVGEEPAAADVAESEDEPADDADREDHPAEDAEAADAEDDGPDAPSGESASVCESCGTDVPADADFCPSCGREVGGGEAEPVDTCPDCGAEIEGDFRFCASCGADLERARDDGPPETLALSAHGRSVLVRDGDTVGREIRSLLTDAGRPEDEAVRVHREHVRFEREGDQFYVEDLGENPTRLNDASMHAGERQAVDPGDDLTLSDVVTLSVERP